MISPIMLYGSEVWGAYLVSNQGTDNSVTNGLQECHTLVEKLHSKVCKQILNVHKSRSNYGVRLDLGRMPLHVNIIIMTLKYYLQMNRRTCVNPLLESAFKLHKDNTSNWYMEIKNVLEFTGYCLETLNIHNIKNSKFFSA